MTSGLVRVAATVIAAWCVLTWDVSAQPSGQMPAVFDGVGMDEQLGETIVADAAFFDEQGRTVRLSDYLQGQKPVLLTLVYHNCPMLCNLVLDGMTRALREMEWTPGEEYEVVTVSFAPDEGPELAARQKERYLGVLDRPAAAAGWHFLTGTEASIQALAGSVGFQFRWVEDAQEYAHPSVLIFLSGEGKISRYLYGLQFEPRDVRTALVEASEGKVGTTVDRLFLYCFRYDPNANSYVIHAVNVMKLGGLLTVLAIAAFLLVFWRRERVNLHKAEGAPG
jgi:protein SCO1